ncbi:MAG TPA: hypothetical protein VE010_19700 [Thermoanaerobaculia bacterium]|nr:hypothetical protein [Thermoanaerobaculia bacterium]
MAIVAITLFACAQASIDRGEWQQMSSEDRLLYVNSLIGAERAKDAKGGGGKNVSNAPEQYVAAIDAAYASGDQRKPDEIFATLVR